MEEDRTGAATADPVRRIAASAWLFRWKVENEAEARFERLAARLEQIGASADLASLARRAAREERRHAELCAELARGYGESLPARPRGAREIAPATLLPRGKVLYEMVAACCISETESMAVLTTLLPSAATPRLREVLHELARDEVGHSRLGWAHLAAEHAAGVTAFLGPLIPGMLEGSIDPELFRPVSSEREAAALLEHGVLPHSAKRRVFTGTLQEVILPGLESCGVDTDPARAWLRAKEEELARAQAGA